MMRQKALVGLLAFILFTTIGRSAGGQQTRVQTRPDIRVSGVVIDAETEATLSNVHYSVSGRTGGITDISGQFSLYARQFDTVLFSMVGYKNTTLIIGSEFTASQYLVMVGMVTDTLQIAEVVVVPRLDGLRSIASGSSLADSKEFENARGNLNLAFHQGLTGVNKTGDPAINYEMLRRKHIIEAYEKGGIPSDRIASFSPLIIIPALYLLMNGLPEKPPAPAPAISNSDLERLRKLYRDKIYKKKLPLEEDSLDNMAGHLWVFFESAR
jgi:hypothetical protein